MADLVEGSESLLRLMIISQSTRTARDLTNGSANLIWSIDEGDVTTSSMTLEDAANGVVSYRFTSTQLTPGTFEADIETTDVDGHTVRATDILTLQVRKKKA